MHPFHAFHSVHREMTIVIQEIATPSLERSTGCNQQQVGGRSFEEVYLFTKRLNFEDAQKYRKSCGKYLRRSQWYDLDVEVVKIL